MHLFWPSDDVYFLLHQSKCYSILFLLRIWSFVKIIRREKSRREKCVCWDYPESIFPITANLKIDAKIGEYEINHPAKGPAPPGVFFMYQLFFMYGLFWMLLGPRPKAQGPRGPTTRPRWRRIINCHLSPFLELCCLLAGWISSMHAWCLVELGLTSH